MDLLDSPRLRKHGCEVQLVVAGAEEQSQEAFAEAAADAWNCVANMFFSNYDIFLDDFWINHIFF